MTPKIFNSKIELIVELPVLAQAKSGPRNFKRMLDAVGIPLEEVLDKTAPLPRSRKTPGRKGMGLPAQQTERVYLKTAIRDSEMNPWDLAHQSAGAFSSRTTFVEPDQLKEFVVDTNESAQYKKSKGNPTAKNSTGNGCDPDWPPKKGTIWHLDDNFSQLRSARSRIDNHPHTIRIGHIDTGYDRTHTVIPDSLRTNSLQRNFVDGEDPFDAHDRKISGALRMPLHGTGTAGILCGNKIKLKTDDGVFNDYLGAAPFAEVIPCRISNSVILFKTSAFAEALQYLTDLTLRGTPVHVISMSMGGAPSKAWADAVNRAYEAGIVLVTAAGNNYNGLPTTHVIYPARFERVIAGCGVTYDLKPYRHTKIGEMQGCYGPERHMDKALAAFTPNTPWACGSDSLVKFSGAGTSSATPQIAAAAAIYYRYHYDELMQLQPWQRVEAIRHALFTSASKTGKPQGTFKKSFGNGILKANDALDVPVRKVTKQTPKDSIPWFPILSTLFKSAPGKQTDNRYTMFNTELAQLAFTYPELNKIIDKEEKPFEKISTTKWSRFKDAVIEHPATSSTLKRHLINANSQKRK